MSDTSRRGADRASRQPDGMPTFVERLDAIDLATAAGFELPPVMIYGDEVFVRDGTVVRSPEVDALLQP